MFQFLMIGYMLELAFIAMPIAFYYYRNKLLSIGGLVLLTAMELSLFLIGNTTLLKGFRYSQPVEPNQGLEAAQVSPGAPDGGGLDWLDDMDHVSRSHSDSRAYSGTRPEEGLKAGDSVYAACTLCGYIVSGKVEGSNESGRALVRFDEKDHPPGSCESLGGVMIYSLDGPHQRTIFGHYEGINNTGLAIIRFDDWGNLARLHGAGVTRRSRTQAGPRPHEAFGAKASKSAQADSTAQASKPSRESPIAGYLTSIPFDPYDQIATDYNARLDENGLALDILDARGHRPGSRSHKAATRPQNGPRPEHLTYKIGVENEQWNMKKKSSKGLFIAVYVVELGAFTTVLVLGAIQVAKADQYCSGP